MDDVSGYWRSVEEARGGLDLLKVSKVFSTRCVTQGSSIVEKVSPAAGSYGGSPLRARRRSVEGW